MQLNIGLLYDDFDPPMTSHLVMAQSALDTGLVDAVWLIPPYEKSVVATYILVRGEEHIHMCSEDEIDSTPDTNFFMILDEDQKGNVSNVLNEFPPIWVNKPENGVVPTKVLDFLTKNE